MNDSVKVSVLCLAYNHENLIRDALEGFVNQKTNFKYEVLINDDASTDNTAQIIKEYADKYPEVIKPIFQEKNLHSQGINIINEVLSKLAQGQYIAVCEGDDYWIDNNKLQMQVDFLDSHADYSAVVHNNYEYDCLKNTKKIKYGNEAKTLEFEDVIKRGGQSFHTSSILVRKEIFFNKPSYFDKAKGFGDYPRSINFILSGPIYYMPQVMSVYRLFSNKTAWSIISDNSEYMIMHSESVIEMLKEVKKYAADNQQKLIDETILDNEYIILELTRQYTTIKQTKKYRAIYDSKDFAYKLKFFAKTILRPNKTSNCKG